MLKNKLESSLLFNVYSDQALNVQLSHLIESQSPQRVRFPPEIWAEVVKKTGLVVKTLLSDSNVVDRESLVPYQLSQ